MKKILSLLALLSLSFATAVATEPVDEFNYEKENISAEFEQLNKIENYVQQNEGLTLEALKAEKSDLVDGITLSADSSSAVAADELPLGIPAFWWGCVLTVLGVILVYVLTDQDKDQTKKALLGCLVTAGVYVIFWVIALATGGFWWF
jgi:cytochrome c biogenesis protein CcdA